MTLHCPYSFEMFFPWVGHAKFPLLYTAPLLCQHSYLWYYVTVMTHAKIIFFYFYSITVNDSIWVQRFHTLLLLVYHLITWFFSRLSLHQRIRYLGSSSKKRYIRIYIYKYISHIAPHSTKNKKQIYSNS